MPAAKQTERAPRRRNKGGRPRVRFGDEVQVTIEFPPLEYAQLCAYVHHLKQAALAARMPVGPHSKKSVLIALWREHWKSLSLAHRKAITKAPAFAEALRTRS